jgi:hypothetical protein
MHIEYYDFILPASPSPFPSAFKWLHSKQSLFDTYVTQFLGLDSINEREYMIAATTLFH